MVLRGNNLTIPVTPEWVISSFDFIDIAKNRAVETFFLTETTTSGTPIYGITNNATYESEAASTRKQTTSDVYTKQHDNTHEVLVDAPISIEGDVFLSIPLQVSVGSGSDGFGFISGALLVSGSTLTTLGDVSGAVVKPSASSTEETLSAMSMRIPRTQIKRGEYLQYRITTWSKNDDNAATVSTYYGFNPNGTSPHGTPNEATFGSTRSYVDATGKLLIPINIPL